MLVDLRISCQMSRDAGDDGFDSGGKIPLCEEMAAHNDNAYGVVDRLASTVMVLQSRINLLTKQQHNSNFNKLKSCS